MSKIGYISRYMLIINKLKSTPYVTLAQMQEHIAGQVRHLQLQDDTLDVGSSKRTLHRDFRDIRNLFGLEIAYSAKEKGYYLQEPEMGSQNYQRMLEAFEVYHSLHASQDMMPYIQLEKRRPQGTEHLYGLLHAIKNRVKVSFRYQKFWEDAASERTVEPYALKEFRNRWYVLAKDPKDGNVKSFALDRLSKLQITAQSFSIPRQYSIDKQYRHCFGIISPYDGKKPEKIILSLSPMQGKYIKSLPLHESQQVFIDSEEEVRISLYLCITHDLVMELLSLGAEVSVLQPASLKEELKQAYTQALAHYL